MCDFSGRLIAWLDNELPASDATLAEQHVRDCAECRSQVESFDAVSRTFAAYAEAYREARCDAAVALAVHGWASRHMPVLAGVVAAVVAVVALYLAYPRSRVAESPIIHASAAAARQSGALQAAPAPLKIVHRQHAAAPLPVQAARWLPPEPTVEIAIPADEMYPPGAIPAGMHLVVDVRVAADGSAQQVPVWP